ncbi:MAG: MFS transporter [Planctomycetales bacterium]
MADRLTAPTGVVHRPERTPRPLKARLYAMMFLQYFVQGAYLPVISAYVQNTLKFDAARVGYFNSALALGPLLAPLFVGQLVDRHLATDRVLAAFHFACGLLMLALYLLSGFWPVLIVATVYSTLYVPSIMLTNSLAFQHLRDRDAEFPAVRVWGTLGFIVPAWIIELWLLQGLKGDALDTARGVILLVSGIGSLVMAAYCLTLPATPPPRREATDLAPGKVVGLMRLPSFRTLVLVSFVVAMAHQFFFTWNSPYLVSMLRRGGVGDAWEQRIASIGQIFEIVVMLALAAALRNFGFKKVLLLGAFAYFARCVILGGAAAWEGPFPAVMTIVGIGEALHGLCFGCFIAVAFMYVDRVAPRDARGSMQNLYGVFVLGSGFVIGGLLSGGVGEVFSSDPDAPTLRARYGIESTAGLATVQVERDDELVEVVRDWPGIWFSGAIVAAIAVAGLAAAFPRDPPREAGPAPVAGPVLPSA